MRPVDPASDDDLVLDALQTKDIKDRLGMTRVTRGQAVSYLMTDAVALVVFKAVRLAVLSVALVVAQKVFDETYTRTVYAEGRDPPLLRNMLLIALSIDATVQLLVMLVALLVRYMYKSPDTSFVIDDALVATVMGEYFISTAVLLVVGLVVAGYMRRKKYFDMRNQGLRVAAAYRDVMLGVCAVNFVIPYMSLWE